MWPGSGPSSGLQGFQQLQVAEMLFLHVWKAPPAVPMRLDFGLMWTIRVGSSPLRAQDRAEDGALGPWRLCTARTGACEVRVASVLVLSGLTAWRTELSSEELCTFAVGLLEGSRAWVLCCSV